MEAVQGIGLIAAAIFVLTAILVGGVEIMHRATHPQQCRHCK